MKKTLAIILSMVILLSAFAIFPISVTAAETDTMGIGAEEDSDEIGLISIFNSFINDPRWSNGVYWGGGTTPKLSGYSSSSCCAYTADFVKYCFGSNSPRAGEAFYDVNQVRAGDVIYITGHWFVILERSGSNLYTAEGNFDNHVRIGWNYTISGSKFAQDSRAFEVGYHFMAGGNYPQGCLDSVTGDVGSIKVKGWAFDRDNTSTALAIHVYIGGPAGTAGAEGYSITANTSRPDVDNVYHTGANHGFDATISTSKSGSQAVYVYALNIGSGDNVELGHATVNISQISYVNLGEDFYANIIAGKDGYAVGIAFDDPSNVCVRTRDDNTNNQKWHFQRNSDGSYRITNVGQNLCLDLDGSSTNDLKNIHLYNANESSNQKWYIKQNDYGYTFIPKCSLSSAMDVYYENFTDGGNILGHSNIGSVAQRFTINYINLTPSIKATYNGHTYELYDIPCNWHQAEVTCKRLGGHLATITSEGENTFVYGLKTQSTKSEYLWLGGNDELVEGSWQWVTDEDFSYHPWATSQPDNAGAVENYLEMNVDGSWNDNGKDYNAHHPVFVCEYDNEEVDESKYTASKTLTYQNKTYEFYDARLTWETAKAVCEAKGGHLVIMDDAAENQAMVDFAQAEVWLGINDIAAEGIWKDVYGNDLVYTNWPSGYPNNYTMCELYGELNKDGTWNDHRYEKLSFICEYDTPSCDHEMIESFVEASADGEQGYILHQCSKCDKSYKDNYMNYNDGWYTPADGSTELPDLIKNDSRFKIQYTNTYEKIQTESPGEGWVNKGVAKTEWVNKGDPYDSYTALTTSDSRALVKECYYHYCIPGAGANSEANYEKSGSFTHYDEFLLPNSNISVEWTGDDNGHTVYVLKWIDHTIYCKSGDSCDGSDGAHDYRSKAWYHKWVYQDKQEVVYYKWVKESYTDAPDPSADGTTVRFKVNDDQAIIGDVNNDGVIDILDAAMIQKYTVESVELTPEQLNVADVNDDGTVDILDVVDIQKYTVEKITEFKKKA